MISITLDPDGQSVTLRLTEYLGGERFARYREIVSSHGGRYVPSSKTNRAAVAAVPGLLRDLQADGYVVELDPQIAAQLTCEADEATALLEAGRQRLASAEAALAASGLHLYPYQRTGVEWLAPRKAALLADQQGLGKSCQALIAAPDQAAVLVVAPAAVSRFWLTECERFRPDLLTGKTASKAQFIWPAPGQLLVCTYGCLPAEDEELPIPPPGLVVVADECHNVKSPTAARTKRFRALSQAARDNGGRVWLLSGTPLLNRPPELWSVLQAAGLAEESFGSWPRFVSAFRGYKGRWGYEWGRATDEVPEMLRKVSLRRHREDVLPDLPTKTRRDLPVNGLDRDTVAACDEALQALSDAGATLDDLAKEVSQSANQILFERMSRARAMLATAKIPALLELVESYEEEEEPVVVFSAHLPPVETLGKREGWGLITGAVSADERGRIVADFQAGKLRGIAGTIGAMGVGVTLTHAHHLILVDLAWTPALNAQAEDRLVRISQTRGVIVTRLIADHLLDRRVTELLTQKQAIIEASVEASAVQADYMGTSPAVELARAAQDAQALVVEAQRTAAEAKVQAEVEAKRTQAEVLQRVNGQHDGREINASHDGRFRGPVNAEEDFVARAILQLAGMDPDHASTVNGVGFSRYDGDFGHSLAEALQGHGRLSDKQWAAAARLAAKYRKQVGAFQA